ncbi:MAG: peptidoglycan bridge formation glycyltransferase FemA/FemB family protein [Candidatus Saccharibacteria bacterium]|nr:peptidoglycan bridge formation glycyltransferase FemA/FemB family protein [Candidatus Saccharibacteria bacterium]
MKIPITQTEDWKKLQDDLKEVSFFEKGKGFQYLAILKNTPVGKYLYLPYGPVADSKDSFKTAIKSLNNLAKSKSAIFIRIEPQTTDFINAFPKHTKKSKDLNPKETWVLDLSGTDDDLKSKLPSRLLRYYKNIDKKGIEIEQSKNIDDIRHLLTLQKALASKKGIGTFSEDYLKTELSQSFATLYLLKYQDPETKTEEIIAAGLVFDDEDTRYNLQGAQSEQGRKLHATGILTIRLIEDAKKSGKTTFDFWGIAPENAPKNHPWQGFTSFKKTFDGKEKDYAGTYDIILNPVKYKLYELTRKLNRLLRRH